ncbi:ATP-binding protein [Clostridium magnum]|uniref:Serine-protein kinase RsbW n=1 Tax=Clostridium magnum DSM 2767 TaxID=1121326 RepID=A0A162T5H3_9CLOT|nr:ATP-binding protein [Clostridium magnum]KZL92264.1 serine-protein kinase RsbW [Clostridium magnum DSM 2767]SHH15727.1 serine/threonine-protein kinase RsbW [Clostridium magnum DSM 2767]
MVINQKKLLLYGLDNYKETIDKVVKDLNIHDYYFDIKLILTEALTNAFYHGNKQDKTKPIILRYYHDDSDIVFEIEHSETNLETIDIFDEISDEDLLKEHGRGLFLIKCFVDKIEVDKNSLVIRKKIGE